MRARDEFKKNWVNPRKYNNTCYIVGGGPSLKGFDWDLLGKDKFVIAINRSYEVLPHAQIIYFTDPEYWEVHRDGMRKHGAWMMRGGLMVDHWHEHCKTGANYWGPMTNQNKDWTNAVRDSIIDATDVYQWHLSDYAGFEERWGYLRHGKNSAYAALNLATMHFKFKKVYLLGLDMGWKTPGDKTQGTHWHDAKNHRIDPEDIYIIMKKAYLSSIPWLQKHLVQVVNVNPNNTLPMFQHKKIEAVFKRK